MTMKTKVPYNAGEIRIDDSGKKVFIAGHIWWPVEKRNAYHCLKVNADGSLNDIPEYIWDHTDGQWALCA
jgi:hypothetical protein